MDILFSSPGLYGIIKLYYRHIAPKPGESPGTGEGHTMKNKITVTISGQDYNMVAAEDAAYVRRCAEFGDGQIRQVTSGSRLALADAAVLAAMNMADLYFKEQESSENLRRQIKDALEANKQLENALSESKREIFKLQNGRH